MKTLKALLFTPRSFLLVAGSMLISNVVAAQTLPDPAPIPAVPPPLAPGSVAMGDPKDFPEVKMDFPMADGPFKPTWESISENYPADPAWLREAKFGFWVHFGPQAAGNSGDWYARKLYMGDTSAYKNHQSDFGHPSETGYMDVLRKWNPAKLDPAAYVKLYHDAGARFLLIQGVHHDNFDLWNSKYQPWNSVNIGPKRDLLGEWSKAVKAAGMRFGVSFHHEYTWWWWQPAFKSDASGSKAGIPYDAARLTLADGKGKWWEGFDPRLLYGINLREYKGLDDFRYRPEQGIFVNHLDYANWYATRWALRIEDVIEKYDPDFFYTDGDDKQPFSGYKTGTGYKSDAAQRVIASYFNRTLKNRGKVDTFAVIKFHPPAKGIVTTFESSYPKAIKTDQPWIGENAVGDWFYKPGIVYSSTAVIRYLLECVSRDGSYAVNIPMAADGSLEPACVTMLHEVGDWMKINGEGIYGSKAWVKLGEGENGQIKNLPAKALDQRQADFPFGPKDFRFTVGKDGALYAFCLTVPAPGTELKITSLGTDAKLLNKPVKSVSLLGSNASLKWNQGADALVITCPGEMAFKTAITFQIR